VNSNTSTDYEIDLSFGSSDGARFNRWLSRVDSAMIEQYGFGIDDIEDYDYYSMWEGSATIDDTVAEAMYNAGYGDSYL